jgi:transposase
MKCAVVLTTAEELTLQQLSVNHHHRDMRIRAAGLLMLGRKLKPTEIAAQLGVSGQSVYNWAHTWREEGIGGLLLRVGHKGGRPRALSEAMVTTALQAASAEPLTRAQIAQRIEADHGEFPCCLETLSVALKREGLSFKRNRYSLKKSATKRNSP